jgi:hypothetical protein
LASGQQRTSSAELQQQMKMLRQPTTVLDLPTCRFLELYRLPTRNNSCRSGDGGSCGDGERSPAPTLDTVAGMLETEYGFRREHFVLMHPRLPFCPDGGDSERRRVLVRVLMLVRMLVHPQAQARRDGFNIHHLFFYRFVGNSPPPVASSSSPLVP